LQKTQVIVDGRPINFKKILIDRCQRDFKRQEEEKPEKERPEEQSDDSAKKIKSKSSNLVKFLGELYNFGMLCARIVHWCIQDLLKRSDEESLDHVCVLLKAAGKKLELQSDGLISSGK
jgi:translation initiation factor 4G